METKNSGFLFGVLVGVVLTLAFAGMQGCADAGGGGHHKSGSGDSGNQGDTIPVVDGSGNPPPAGPTGFISFHVDWPERDLQNALIDPATQWLRIRVKEAGGATYFVKPDLTPSTTTATLEVPVGTYTVAVLAFTAFQDQFNTYLKLLSNGSAVNPVVVVLHQMTQANVTLSASTGVFTEPPAPVYYGDRPYVELELMSYPPEVKQGAMWFGSSVTIDPVCSLAATPDTFEPLIRGCTAVNPFPSSGSFVAFSAYLDGSAYAVDWDGAGPGLPSLWPSDSSIMDDTITIRSSSILFQAPPPTGMTVGIDLRR